MFNLKRHAQSRTYILISGDYGTLEERDVSEMGPFTFDKVKILYDDNDENGLARIITKNVPSESYEIINESEVPKEKLLILQGKRNYYL